MFLFFNSSENDEGSNRNYLKGIQFEKLLARYLSASGYEVELRRKRNSLEYDIEGRHCVDNRLVIGEAKAYEKTVPAQQVSAFVGKLLPFAESRAAVGLFLSTSSITPEAADYLRSVENIISICEYSGSRLEEQVVSALKLPNPQSTKHQSKRMGLYSLSNHLLSADDQILQVQLLAQRGSVTASRFICIREDGDLVTDEDYLAALNTNVPELQALEPVVLSSAHSSESQSPIFRNIARGLTLGTDWDDYRLPAAPGVFIGRESIVEEVQQHINDGLRPNIIQLKSRSGVGKSSMLGFLDAKQREIGNVTELHDARDIKSIFDLFAVVQRFTESKEAPKDFLEVGNQLRGLSDSLDHKQRAVFFVDQFEALFKNQSLFDAYEALASSFINLRPQLCLCLARKNDLLTTYDHKVSLEKLNDISKHYNLQDFEPGEAGELIGRIGQLSPTNVNKEIRAYVLEFAQGFPWLIKRTMAHILRLVSKGYSQGELFAAGLGLDELFNEELEGLDELERGYLVRIAARLPANFQQLQNEFDQDPLLPQILAKLTHCRLLRLSGSTYDTYNDVFKEYLIYKRLPNYRRAFILRYQPNSVMRGFQKIVEARKFTVDWYIRSFSVSKGTAFNRIHELRNLGVITRESQGWKVPQSVVDVYDRGRLGGLIRSSLMENSAIADLVSVVTKTGHFPVEKMPQYLEEKFVFVQASKKTWQVYANVMISWLTRTKLLDLTTSEMLTPPCASKDEIVDEIGNLRPIHGRRTGSRRLYSTVLTGPFLPGAHWSTVESAAYKLFNKEQSFSKEEKKALLDLKQLSLAGRPFDEIREKVLETLDLPVYQRFWDAARNEESLRPAIEELVGTELRESTLKWRYKLLLNWGKNLGIIEDKRYSFEGRSPTYHHSQQQVLFDF